MERKSWKDCAKEVGITPHEMYWGLRTGRLPGYRVGSSDRGRWYCDVELVRARINELMLSNIKDEATSQHGSIRRVK